MGEEEEEEEGPDWWYNVWRSYAEVGTQLKKNE